MPNSHRVMVFIKILHTLIWFIMASGVFYILYCGLSGQMGNALYFAFGLLLFEVIVLLLNRWSCPLTIVAQKIKTDWKDGDDIYLPVWLAKRNKTIFGTLLLIGMLLVIFRIFLRSNNL